LSPRELALPLREYAIFAIPARRGSHAKFAVSAAIIMLNQFRDNGKAPKKVRVVSFSQFELSYDYVGDLSETVALMWPAPFVKGSGTPRPIAHVRHSNGKLGRQSAPSPLVGQGWGGGWRVCDAGASSHDPHPQPLPTASRACPTCALWCGTRASPRSVGRGAHRDRRPDIERGHHCTLLVRQSGAAGTARTLARPPR
jgi:hypothetical protein